MGLSRAVKDAWPGAGRAGGGGGRAGQSSEGPLAGGERMTRSLDLGRGRSLGLVQAADAVAMEACLALL